MSQGPASSVGQGSGAPAQGRGDEGFGRKADTQRAGVPFALAARYGAKGEGAMRALAALAAVALLWGCGGRVASNAASKVDGALLTTGGDGRDWAAAGFNYAEQRYSPLTQVNAGNVAQLGLALGRRHARRARAGGDADRYRRQAVRDGSVVQGLRVRRRDRPTAVAVRSGCGQAEGRAGVLRRRQSRRRGVEGATVPRHAGRAADRSRRRHGRGRLVGADHRQQPALYDHRRAAGW